MTFSKSTTIILSIGVVSSFATVERVHAQPCDSQSSATATGDASFTGAGAFAAPSVADLVASSSWRNSFLVSPLGLDTCITDEADWKVRFDGGSCASANSTYGDVDCASRRLLNAMVFLDKVPYGASWSWRQYVNAHLSWTEFRPDQCEQTAGSFLSINACGTSGGRAWLSHTALFSSNLVERAHVIAHEAAHGGTGKNHCDDDDQRCSCNRGGSACDPSYAFGGPYAKSIDFYDAALNVQGLITNPFLRSQTFSSANEIILNRFEENPGFLLRGDPESTVAEAIRQPWDAFMGGPIQIAWASDPDGPVEYMQGVGVAAHGGTRTMSRLSVSRGIMEFKPFENKIYRTIAAKGGGTFNTSGDNPAPLTQHPQTWVWLAAPSLASEPEALVWSPSGITRLALRAAPDGTISHLLGRRTSIVSGYAAGTTSTLTASGSPSSWDIDVATSSGFFMTGLSLGMAQSGAARVSGVAWNQRLGPEFKPLAGGLGGNAGRLSCPSGYVAIGTQQKAASSQYGPVVGYFALVCAQEQYIQNCRTSPQGPWVPCGASEDPNTRRIVRTSYREGSTYYSPGTWLWTSPAPAGLTTTICPPLSRLRGVTVQSGVLVDRINSIRCTNGYSYGVNVGGTGGALKTHDCWFGTPPAIPSTFAHLESVYFRSGDLLDGLAAGCKGPFDTTMTFSFSGSEQLDFANTLGWQVGVSDFGAIPDANFLPANLGVHSGSAPRRTSLGTGPASSSTGAYALYRGDSGTYYTTLTRHALDLRGAPAYQSTRSPRLSTYLKFRYHMFTPQNLTLPGEVAVLVRPTGSTALVASPSFQSMTSPGDQWAEVVVSLAPWHGQIVDVQVRLARLQGQSVDIALDEVEIVTQAEVLP